MTRAFCLLFSLAMGTLYATSVPADDLTHGDSWTEVQIAKQGTISVIYRPGAPWAMVDENGELTGFEIELFRYFLNYLETSHGITLEVNWIPEENFEALYSRVRTGSGGIFGLSKISIRDRRRSEVGFSPPYLNNIPVLITHEGVGELESLDQLTGFEGLTVRGTTMEAAMTELATRHLPDLELTYLDRSAEICVRVASTESPSFAIVDLVSAWQLIDGLPLKRQELGAGEPEPYGIIVPLDSDWLLPLNSFLEGEKGRLRSTSAYYGLLRRYFGQEITEVLREVGID